MYAYLRISTRDVDRVVFPDGQSMIVARGAGAGTASEWRESQVPADDAARQRAVENERALRREEQRRVRMAEHESRHAAWREGLDRALQSVTSISEARAVRERYPLDHPEPTLDDEHESVEEAPIPLVDALGVAHPEVKSERWWFASLVGVDEPEDIPLDRRSAYPRAAVARALTDLESRGWIVVDVSEERVVTHSGPNSSAYVAAAWFLLRGGSD